MLPLIRYRLLFLTAFFASVASAVYLEGNGYKDFVVAFSPRIKVGDVNFEKIKEVMQASSEVLFVATRKRFYISEVTFALPLSLSDAFCSEASSGESTMPRDITVYVTESSGGEFLDEARAQHSRGCGETGEVIYVSASWLKGRTEDLSRQFVQQWSTYRYGVFEETPIADDHCFTTDGIVWAPAGCYNVRIPTTPTWNERGLPECEPISDISQYPEMTSSLMFTANASNVINFCDNSEQHLHRHLVSNLHNNICDRRSVWEVMQDAEDFKYGSNVESNFESTNISVNFKCLVEERQQFIIAIQNSTVPQIEDMVIAVRNSLLRFLVYDVPRDRDVTVVTFSDASYTEAMRPLRLDLTRPDQVRKSLVGNIITAFEDILPCLRCGLKKSIQLSELSGNGNPVIVFVSLASTVRSQSTWEVVRDIEESNVPIFLIVIEDVTNVVIPADLVDAVVTAGGKVFALPSDPFALRTRLNVVLASVPTSPFHMENEVMVIHQQTYVLKGGIIEEKFPSDFGLEGRMVYTVNCNRTEKIEEAISNCTSEENLVYTDQEFGCVTNLTADMWSNQWESSFQIPFSFYDVVCSTLATVQLQPTLNSAVTLRGWISETMIRPGENNLIMYAELRRNSIPVINATVYAEIYLPGANRSLPLIISLWDSGNGDPDVKKGDGIYSRYFTEFTERGMYSVLIRATGFVALDTSKFYSDNTNGDQTDFKFSRVVAIGSFSVTRNPPTKDIYPPSRIGDLKVLAVDHEANNVTLQWTAPGDDFDQGTVEKYEVKCSPTWKDLTKYTFGFADATCLLEVFPSNTNKMVESGHLISKTFYLPFNKERILYFIAMRAVDKETNYAEISNIIQVFVKHSETSVIPETTTIISEEVSATKSFITTTEFRNGSVNSEIVSEMTTLVLKSSESSNMTETIDKETVLPTASKESTNESCENEIRYVTYMAAGIGGGIFVLIIIINVIICCVCIKKRKKYPKKLSRQASLLPPHNMSIVYHPYTNRTDENRFDSISQNVFVDNSVYDRPQNNSQAEYDSTYHPPNPNVNRISLQNGFRNSQLRKSNRQSVDRVQSYATTSLTNQSQVSTDTSSSLKPNFNSLTHPAEATAQPQQGPASNKTRDETSIYALGVV